MKAFLLAGGEGTRLRPLTYGIPKCLVPIKGKPLLGYWLKLCKKYGISQVLINLHYLPQVVEEFLNKNSYDLKIIRFYEKKLLGTARTIIANRDFVEKEKEFFIFYADNLTNMNLVRFLRYHRSRKSFFTMGLFRTNLPSQCGIAKLDKNGLVVSFEEKPENPKTNLANAGAYITSPEIFNYIPEREGVDLGYHVLPKLVGKMYGYLIKEYFLDIGTWENYNRAQEEWEELESKPISERTQK